jgi:peptidyl-prolyl cis-trans isomerase B (cyclophilin B)
MARTGDPHSATSQFFVNVVDNDFLNFKSKDMRGWGYAVFAKVVVGMDVVDKIKAVKTAHKGGHGDVPLEAVIINKAELLDKLPGTDKKTEVKKEVPTEDEIKTHADEKGK